MYEKIKCYFVPLLILALNIFISAAKSETLKVGLLTSSASHRLFYVEAAKEFEKNNPGIKVEFIFLPDAEYKIEIEKWFAQGNGPDILGWQGGERLFQRVRSEQIRSLKTLWDSHNLVETFNEGAIGAISYKGEPYGVPVSYYQWGFYYRESLFKQLSLSPPKTWEEFLFVCKELKRANIIPITIGAKNKWTTASWFDYINLRINGLEFHRSLLDGSISFTDKRVYQIFEVWKELLVNEYFVERYNGWNWQQAMPFLYHKLAGMTLIGNFFSTAMPTAIREDFKFFKFPIIDTKMPIYEEAPIDLFMVPKYASPTPAIDKFLLLLSSSGFQERLNEAMTMISPNVEAKISDDYFTTVGSKILNDAQGVSQYLDIDTDGQMASAATKIFTEFLGNQDIEEAITKLEQARSQYLL